MWSLLLYLSWKYIIMSEECIYVYVILHTIILDSIIGEFFFFFLKGICATPSVCHA